jgi:hypothetical protein
MNTPERRTEHRESHIDWANRKEPRHIPQQVIEAVRRKLSFTNIDKVTSIR